MGVDRNEAGGVSCCGNQVRKVPGVSLRDALGQCADRRHFTLAETGEPEIGIDMQKP